MALEKVGLHAVISGMGAFRAAGTEIDRTYDRLGTSSGRAAGRMSKLGDIAKTAIGFAVGTVAVSAIKSLTSGLVGLVASAAPLKDMEDAFNRLTATYDLSSEKMMAAMRRASKGTIADSDLIESANKALIGSGKALGKEFGEALPKLLEMARASAKATGEDVGFLFQSLVLGIKRSSPMIIDNTGLQLKLSEAYQATADAIGVNVDELSAEQKQIALLNATLKAGEGMVAAMGTEALTTTEKMGRLRTMGKNLRDQFAKALLPILDMFLDILTPIAETLAAKVLPAMERAIGRVIDFTVALRSFSLGGFVGGLWERFMPEWLETRLQRVMEGLRDVLSIFGAFRGAGIWGALGRLRDLVSQAFGPKVSKIFDRFLGSLFGLVANIRAWWQTGPITTLLQRIREGWATRIAGPIANWWEQSGLKARFDNIISGLRAWWEEAGGVAGILKTIREGWATRIAGPAANWWATSGLKARFDQLTKGITEWWDELGAEQGALGKIKAGWQRYLADPLTGFWMSSSMAAKFQRLHEALDKWWQDQTKETGVLGAIAAGWQTYIADPLENFWIESGLSEHFATLKSKIGDWAEKAWGWIYQKLIKPLEGFPDVVRKVWAEMELVIAKELPPVKRRTAWESFLAGLKLLFVPSPTVLTHLRAIKDIVFEVLGLFKDIGLIILAWLWEHLPGIIRRLIDTQGETDRWHRLNQWILKDYERVHTEIALLRADLWAAVGATDELGEAIRRLPPYPRPVPPTPQYPWEYHTPGYQRGGVIPGPSSAVRMIMAHGGEQVLTLAQRKQMSALLMRVAGLVSDVPVPALAAAGRVGAGTTINYNWYPSLSATYQDVQSPGSIVQDLETLAILHRMT